MSLSPLNAISPIDGRYRSKVSSLADYFSEEALIKYRVKVEIDYFIAFISSCYQFVWNEQHSNGETIG